MYTLCNNGVRILKYWQRSLSIFLGEKKITTTQGCHVMQILSYAKTFSFQHQVNDSSAKPLVPRQNERATAQKPSWQTPRELTSTQVTVPWNHARWAQCGKESGQMHNSMLSPSWSSAQQGLLLPDIGWLGWFWVAHSWCCEIEHSSDRFHGKTTGAYWG